MNTCINFVKKSSAGKATRGEVEVLGEVGALLLPASDFTPASSSCFLGMLAGGLTQRLRQMMQDLGAIAKNGGLNVILLSGLADLLSMELLKLQNN